MANGKVLISTIDTASGGVPQMVIFAAQCLYENGYKPVLGYYASYTLSPKLSVPSFKLFQQTVNERVFSTVNGYESHAIGAWLPELEFTDYLPTKYWKRLIKTCQYHIAVSGNCLPCSPFALTDTKFLAWIATPWNEDRKDRVSLFPWYRKTLDRLINRNIIRVLEKRILRKGTILALSHYTKQKLNAIVNKNVTHDILHMPVDTDLFYPATHRVIQGRIGFTGRYNDPRKNIALLVQAINYCRSKVPEITLELIGDYPELKLQSYIKSLGLTDKIHFIPFMPHENEDFRLHLQTFDIFVIPSYQEGLCIAALEAMACGCPVISTRCGGPEEFVIDGRTGYCVDSDVFSMAEAISKIITNRELRGRLSAGAREIIEKNYNQLTAKERFWKAFKHTFLNRT